MAYVTERGRERCWVRISVTFFIFFYLFFLWLHLQHMEVSGPGVKWQLQLRPIPQPPQHWICTASSTYSATWDNARFLTQWARPGIKPASSQRQHWALNPLNHNGTPQLNFWRNFLRPSESIEAMRVIEISSIFIQLQVFIPRPPMALHEKNKEQGVRDGRLPQWHEIPPRNFSQMVQNI